MKKMLFMLTACLLAVLFCACGGTGANNEEAAPTPPENSTVVESALPAPSPSVYTEAAAPEPALSIARLDPLNPPRAPFQWKQIVQNSAFQLGPVEKSGDTYTAGLGTYPCIDGSTVAIPMAEEFARQHLGLSETYGFVVFNKTHSAYENLIFKQKENAAEGCFVYLDSPDPPTGQAIATVAEHSTDLIIVTAPSDEELQLAADNGVELVMEPVCWDAFVFITYPDNPVDNLSIDQIRGIYTGEITNWNQVGGEDLPIRAYSRNPNSGSQTAMENLVMRGTPIAKSILTEDMVGDMGSLLDSASSRYEDSGGMGYTYQYYLFQASGEGQQYSPGEDIKTLSINGVAPSPENITAGSYPFSVNYYGVIRKGDEQKTGGLFLDWMLSEEGQACIRQAGYIAMDGSHVSSFYFDSDGFIFPGSSERLLTEADFIRLKRYVYWHYDQRVPELLGFARNEIFARHGNSFENPAYAEHYAQYEWYNSLDHHKVELEELNPVEQANVKLILEWEADVRAD